MNRNLLAIVLSALLLATAAKPLGAAEPQKQIYLDRVITILRLHADAIRQLASHRFKYSHNIARHANALRRTFGLLGPMSWHAAESASLQREKSGFVPLQAAAFEKMAGHCQKSIKDLHQESIRLVDGATKAETVLKALDEVQAGCDGCHALLDGIAPDVWGRGGDG